MKLADISIGTSYKSPFGQTLKLGDLVSSFLNNSIVVSGVLLLFFFVFAGIAVISGAGSGNSEQAAKGQKAATMAAVGFIVVFVAYWMIRLVEEITGTKFITSPGGI